MTDKPVMTKGELEKLGYIVTNQHQVISPDGWEFMTGGDALQAATAHYHQQEELARLRRVVQGVYESASFMKANCLTVQDWPKIALDIDVLYGWMQDVCDDLNIKKWDKPTVSEGEAK